MSNSFAVDNWFSDQYELAGFTYTLHTKTIKSASIADHSVRAEVGSDSGASSVNSNGKNNLYFAVPNGVQWTCIGALITVKNTLTTTVNGGGLVEFECDGLNWKPCEYYTNNQTALTSTSTGGLAVSPLFIPLWKPVPTNGIVRVFYTADNSATDELTVTLYVSETPFSGKATYSKSGKGAAVTQTTIAANHVTITPSPTLNGTIQGFVSQGFPALETIVVSGGILTVKAPDLNCDQFQWNTNGVTCIGAGAMVLEVQKIPCYVPYIAAATLNFDFLPTDNQSQYMKVSVVFFA